MLPSTRTFIMKLLNVEMDECAETGPNNQTFRCPPASQLMN